MSREAMQKELRESHQRTRGMAEGDRFPFRLIGGFIVIVASWVIFSQLVVPSIIESAYHGESLPFLNDIISGQTIHPVEHYLADWERLSWRLLGMLVVVGLIPIPLLATRPELQSYLEARSGRTLALNPAVTNTVLALFGFALVFYLYFLHPVGYVYFITEDYWAEYGSFVSWGMASCFLGWMLFKDRGVRKPVFVLFALGTFFVAMEEISWGQRILELRSPTFFAEYNSQRETNLHNLLGVFPRYSTIGFATFVWSILLPLLTRKWERLGEWCSKMGIPIVPIHLWPFFLLAIFYLIYLPDHPDSPVFKSGEAGELFLGIAIAALSLDLVLTMRRDTRAQGASATIATASMISTLGILTLFLVQVVSSPEDLRGRLTQFAGTRFPNAGMHRQAEMVFNYINQYPQFLTPDTHFRQGVLLMQMGQHSKAREILRLALADQRRFEQKWPESSKPHRIAGQVLILLGRQEEAEAAFLEAIEKDRARLKLNNDGGAKARIRWSLAKTLLASGDSEAASEQVSIARALVSDRKTQFRIDVWIRKNLR